MGFLGANGEVVEVGASRPRNDAAGGWVDGGENPYLGTGQAGEDPLQTAAKEMQATIAVHAFQKAQLSGAMAGIVGGGVPSANAISNWNRTGHTPDAIANPYAHLSRDEKIALIVQLQKSKQGQAIASAPSYDSALPGDLVDPIEEFSKSGVFAKSATAPAKPQPTITKPKMSPPAATPSRPHKKPGTNALAGPTQPSSSVQKGGPADAPMSATQLKKPEKDEVERKEENAMLKADALEGLNALRKGMKKSEGSRGGKVVGHTKSGKAIYSDFKHSSHAAFSGEDHLDASKARTKTIQQGTYAERDHAKEQNKKHYDMAFKMGATKLNKAMVVGNPFASIDDSVDHERPGRDMNTIGAEASTQPAGEPSQGTGRENTRPGGSGDGNEHPFFVKPSGFEPRKGQPKPDGQQAKDDFEPEKKLLKSYAKARELAKSVLQKGETSKEGEGTRGGKVIGHTPTGKPIYAPTSGHMDIVKEHVNLQKRTAKGKLAEHAAGHVAHSAKDYSPEDHKHASEQHAKESRDPKNSPKVQAFHGAISEAHGALAQGKPTPAHAEAARLDAAAKKRTAAAGKKEAARKKDVVAVAPGGHKIMNTHHVRNSSGFGPEGPLEGPAKGQGGKFGLTHPPIETEAGAHLTHEQHKDIAAHHNERAHHHAVQASVHPSISERINHRKTMEQHQHAAKYHEGEASKKMSATHQDPNQGKFPFAKSRTNMKTNKKLAKAMGKMGAFAEDVLHKNVDHPRPGADMTPMTGFETGKKRAPDQGVGKLETANASNSSPSNAYAAPHGVGDDDKTPGMKGGEFVDHPRAGAMDQGAQYHKPSGFEPSHPAAQASREGGTSDEEFEPKKSKKLKKAMYRLEEFAKGEAGQGGMPDAGDPPHMFPTGRRVVDGGSLEGVGAPEGAQDAGEQTVASTSQYSGHGEDENLRELSKRFDASGTGNADLESEAGGEKLQKGIFVDWNEAADDGEYLRAQLASQLMNKSLDVSFGIGVKAPARQVPAQVARIPKVYLQKGGNTVYVDSEDERIEKSMERAGGLTFSQGPSMNLGAPVQHDATCGHCGALTKSFLSSCTECGLSHSGSPILDQGLRIEKSVASTLFPGAEDDIAIG